MAKSSLMGTLAKVAIGVAVAKGAKAMMSGKSNSRQSGGLFGGQFSNNNQQSSPMDMISGLLSGGQQQGSGTGGLGGILESLSGGGASSSSGGLNGLLGGLSGQMQSGGTSGGLGGLLGGLAAAAGVSGASSNNQGFGAMLNQAVANKGVVTEQPSADQEAIAGLMLVAMIQAAKSDGNVDKEEVAKFTKDLGDIDEQEMAFIQQAMESPVDVQGLARQTPNGLQAQVYTMSVLGIDLDNQKEAQYLHELATAFGLSQDQVNGIHDQLGAPRIYQ